MVFFSDGYSVSGKFGSNTGASSSKSKSYGYKGKKKKAPKETKNYGVNTNVKVRPDGTVKDDDNKVTGDPSKDKAESTADLTQYVKDEKVFENTLKAQEKAASVADLQLEADINKGYEKAVAEQSLQQEVIDNKTYEKSQTVTTTTPTTTTSPKDDTSTATTSPTSVDMSSSGDENKPSKATSATSTGGGGGTATDMEELPLDPQKLKSAYRRRVKRKGKRDLRISSKDTGLNIPAGSSGLGIPT